MTNAAAHELRTPLARLQFRSSLLSEEEDPELRAQLQEGIERNIKELQAMIDAVLQYGKISRCDIPLHREKTRLSSWLHKIVTQERETCSLKMTLKCFATEASVDRKLLYIALQNLLGNARKYARSQILLTVCPSEDKTLFIVDDDGPGVPQKHQGMLFEPFYRLDRTQDLTKGGSGLGLSFVKLIAEHHRGQVSVIKSPLGGARFILTISSAGSDTLGNSR
ncbi:ATP-binding protein [Dongshaea marina]|uniref:ATP-binding protein n=1 Tax=Dongshaea marina TaxID=2047966 RepID=UPI00131F1C83|nr:ATP-binding protein [Dongshaea marina]